MLGGNGVDELHDNHGLAYSRTPENPCLSPFGEGCHQIYHLQSSFEDLGAGALLFEARWWLVNRPMLLRLNGPSAIDGLPQDVEQTPQRRLPHWHGYRRPSRDSFHATTQTIGGIHGQAAYPLIAQVLLHLQYQLPFAVLRNLHGIVDLRKLLGGKLNIHHRPDHLNDSAGPLLCHQYLILLEQHSTHDLGSGVSILSGHRSGSSQRLGASCDVQQLLGDSFLASPVVRQGQVIHQGCGVLGRRPHSHHPRRMLARLSI